ncbi:hypothetical protein [Oceanivirga salmonicida]|uniref:hypothetical protein n=1 Tax=Oceanivirga salmonicida TaxID=1769291 RepID=UPI0012E14BDE|nr:hypothetical protein [Oceanivirga salmonicida]
MKKIVELNNNELMEINGGRYFFYDKNAAIRLQNHYDQYIRWTLILRKIGF